MILCPKTIFVPSPGSYTNRVVCIKLYMLLDAISIHRVGIMCDVDVFACGKRAK